MATVLHFVFLRLLTLVLLAQARLYLETTDHETLLAIYKDLGASTGSNGICNAAGIFCERRISNGTNVLRVTRIVFKHRRLTGSISLEIGKLSELKELSLPNNHLLNQIPPQITDCRKLEVLNLQSNGFSGEVPSGLSSLIRLRILDLSSNKFSGDLDFLTYNFPNLQKLSLANNMFTGKVPASLQSFRNLRFCNLSGNSFLEGTMPTIYKLESSSFDSTTNEGSNSDNLQAPAPLPTGKPIHKHTNKKKRIIPWILGFSFATLAVIICGMFFSVVRIKIVKKKESSIAIFSLKIKPQDLAFLEKDDGVANLQVIGKGGCGEVYKKDVPRSKVKAIAIKKVIRPQKDTSELVEEDTRFLHKKMQQIKSELQTVGQIRHRNLLPLLAHVSRPYCQYLVYEFMKNGSFCNRLKMVAEN